jgi:ribonuclease HI
MPYISEDKTKAKANEFIKYLEEAGYQVEMPENAFRDYLVKIGVSVRGDDIGKITIYHKPSKNFYSIKLNELKESERDAILSLWENMNVDDKVIPYKNEGIEIDVDGSFRNGKTSYAYIIRKDGDVIRHGSGLMNEKEVNKTNQVAGELRAAMEAVKWCKENNIPEVTIYYDMQGIEKWATGKWKTNNEITKAFRKFMQETDVKINWVKVTSHTGLKWNEAVDKLAAQALGT